MQDPLYQVMVETRGGGLIPAFPAMSKDACDSLASTVAGQIAIGREKNWSNPTVTRVFSL